MISGRYAPVLCVLVGLALVPTTIHTYMNLTFSDGRRTSQLPEVLADYRAIAGKRNVGWGQRRFESDDWIDRRYIRGGDDVTLTVVRSYDLKALYHHPELAIAYHDGHAFQPERIERFPGRQAVPVHVLRAVAPDTAIAMYVLEYERMFVDNPIAFQIRTAGALLFSARKAMTLLFVEDANLPPNVDLTSAGVTRVLFAAVDRFDGLTGDVANNAKTAR
jgi:hypothetical protein